MPTPASLIDDFKNRKKKEKPINNDGKEQKPKPKNGCGNRDYCMNICPIIGC